MVHRTHMKKSKAVKAKKTVTKKAKKITKKVINKKSTLVDQAKKVVANRVADNRLLEAASLQYTRLLKELARRKKQLSQDKQVAIEIGERILAKAKEVGSTLVRK